MKNNFINKKKGFTLIELVVVIAILGILAGIAIPRFMEAQAAARGAKLVADLRTIDSACTVYHVKNGQMATSLEELLQGDSDNLYLASAPIPPDNEMLVQQNNNTSKKFTHSEAAYKVVNGRATYTCGEGADKSVEWYLGMLNGFAAEADTQANWFIAYMNKWLAAHPGANLSNGATKGQLYTDYYMTNAAAVEEMSAEYKQQLNEQGLNNNLLHREFYWWTYPIVDGNGKVLFNITYANDRSDPAEWTASGTPRAAMAKAYVITINGTTYMRSNSGASVSPGWQNNYQSVAALETALQNAGYKVVNIK